MTQDIIRMAAQQALNLIERLNLRGWILADFEEEVYASIAALKAALAQPPLPEQEQAKPGQEPTPWRDMVVVSLVREGINKHKARELADHFAAQPVQEPVGEVVEVSDNGFRCDFNRRLAVGTRLYIAPPAAQRPWQGMTEQDMPSGEDPMFDHPYFIAGLVYAAKVLQEKNNAAPAAQPEQRKPLTEQEIGAILEDINAFGTRLYTFARAIEAAHNIKEQP